MNRPAKLTLALLCAALLPSAARADAEVPADIRSDCESQCKRQYPDLGRLGPLVARKAACVGMCIANQKAARARVQADMAESRRQERAAQKKKEEPANPPPRKAPPVKRNPQLVSCLNTANGLNRAARKVRIDYCNRSFPAKKTGNASATQ